MESTMGPPLPAGYSLRVKLFAPNAHSAVDNPIRCFRVVTSPEVTVRQFCEEASRIHEINYGEPLAIKKVQDEDCFDITQSETLGNLFATTNIIRVVQAFASRSARDSVPPSSALRYEPSTSRRRGREESSRPEENGRTSPNKAHKRQRISSPNPDEPLPSQEVEAEVAGPSNANRRTLGHKVIPDSQGSIVSGMQKVLNGRQVRQDLPMIPETPSPSPPPEDLVPRSNGLALADGFFSKLNDNPDNEDSSFLSNPDSSPLRGASIRAQSNIPNARAKSASYHIQRATERGTSVSTAATSPLSLDQRNNVEGGATSSLKRKRPSPTLPKLNGNQFRSHNEDSIYETIVSEDEGAAILRRRTDAFKFKNSPRAILPGARNANTTPNGPTGLRRTSAGRESGNSPAELQLTPGSDKRRKQEQKEAEDARKARAAAAEAAEQRKREAEEARQAEVLRVAAEERRQREEQERLDVEEFNRNQAEINQKLIEKAAQAEAERNQRAEQEAKEAREREEARIAREEAQEKQRREEIRIAREKAEQERREQSAEKARIAAKRSEQDRLAKEKIAAEAKRLRKEREAIDREERESVAAEIEDEITGSQKSARSSNGGSQRSSPALPRATPIPPPPRPQTSSTSFIPGGRKSNLKQTSSSQAARSSSPSVARSISRDTSHGVGIEDQLPLAKRKVSFNEETITPHRETRIVPPGKKLTPASTVTTPKPVVQSGPTSSQATKMAAGSPAITAKSAVQNQASSSQAAKKTPILPPPARRSSTPIVPPKVSALRQEKGATPVPGPAPKPAEPTSHERAATPTAQTKIQPPQQATPAAAKKLLVSSQKLKTYGRATPTVQKKGTPVPVIANSPKDDSTDDESDEDTSAKVPAKSATRDVLSSNTTIKFEPPPSREESEDGDENDEMDVDETQSHNSSPPEQSRDSRSDSRSPITFNRSPKQGTISKQRSPSPVSASSVDEEEVESDQESSEDEEEVTPKPAEKVSRVEVQQIEDEASSDSGKSLDSGDDEDEEEAPKVVRRLTKPAIAQDEEGASSDESSKSDEEEASKVVVKPVKDAIDQNEEDVSSDESSKSDGEEEDGSDEEEEPQVQVPQSSPELPRHKEFAKPALSKVAQNIKGSSSARSRNTQDEIDRQLTSSIHEARSARSSSIPNAIPASSTAVQPKFKFGASLTSLVASKANLTQSSAPKPTGAMASSQRQLAQLDEEEESEEESEEEDESSSDEEVEAPNVNNTVPKTSKPASKEADSQKNSDDSDSDSESGADDEERTRQDLFASINAVANQKGASQTSVPSPQAFRSSTQEVGKPKKVEKKKTDKWITGYSFNAPA